MKLRSLHIKGFKSFANNTIVNFNDEIIGIVGPNGSGKSNIVDSIRWVLGEQKSKDLRLEKMVDVIFNGTKSKKKAAMAEVSMTFENSKKLIPLEYDEVKVTRILHATNESEYRINDVPCRLKDIRNLFLDTGIGSNSYAIIELGMVEDILNDKDNARRKMFEQAAGIAKYKTRKRETQLKLNNTQIDLDRIEDLLFELSNSMKTFEKQAKRAKKYYELKTEYKDLSIKTVLISQRDAIKNEQNLKDQLAKLQDEYNENTNTLHKLEAELQETKKANLDREQSLSIKQKQFNDLVDTIRAQESQLAISKQDLNFNTLNKDRLVNNIKDAISAYETLSSKVNDRRGHLETLQSKTNNLKTEFSDWENKYNEVETKRKEAQGASDTELNELKDLEDRRFAFEKEIIELNSESSNFNLNVENYTLEKSGIRTEIDSLNKSLSELKVNRNELKIEIDLLQNRITSNTDKISELDQKLQENRKSLSEWNRTKDGKKNEFDLLEDMVNNLEGFPESSKFLLNNWEQKKPILSEILTCKEEFRSSVEAYLEPFLNYFVLDSFDEAKNSIQLLKSAQKGKSKFFILSSFLHSPRTEVLFDSYGIPALDVVKCDSKYQSLIAHLLGNVVFVDDDKILSSDFPKENIVYLSKTDSTNRARHSMSGGSLGLFDGKRIGRKQELLTLKKTIQEAEAKIDAINLEIDSLENQILDLDIEEYSNSKKEKQDTLASLDIQIAQLETKIKTGEESLLNIEGKLSEFSSFTGKNTHKVTDLRGQLQLIISSINKKKEVISTRTGFIEEIANEFSHVSSKYSQIQIDWVQHQNEISNLENEIKLQVSQMDEIKNKREEYETEKDAIIQKIETAMATIESLENALKEFYQKKELAQNELTDSEQTFFSKRNLISEKEEEIKGFNKSLQEATLEINNLKDKLTNLGFELRSSMERLKIEFKVDVKSLNTEELLEEIKDELVLAERYERIKKRLNNYGEINPMAIEAFDEINERYINMEQQRNDILEAKASLLETIKEIDKDATQKYIDAFEKVKENFKEVFRSLFSTEDDCDLILLDETEPLLSAIEIVAKPKGKRPKTLKQLSGGEKTLTATALLFSLYLLKPAPFCIFDEVDAPLDDHNIQKFSKLIRQFADASQFIVITHNKSTMANMDLLYGVYMQDMGVSGISPVDFKEYEHQELLTTVNLN